MNNFPKSKGCNNIVPIVCGVLLSCLCLYMLRESLSVLFPPEPPKPTRLPPESQWVSEAVQEIAKKYPDHEKKGSIGAVFFLVLGGFGLLFFGGGTLLVIYRTWFSPTATFKK